MYNDKGKYFCEIALHLYDKLHMILTVLCTVAECLQSDGGSDNNNYVLI
jgi:hypothetical protein